MVKENFKGGKMKFKIGDYICHGSRYGKVIAFDRHNIQAAIHFNDNKGIQLDNIVIDAWRKFNYVLDETYTLSFIGKNISWVYMENCALAVGSNQSLSQNKEKPCKVCQRINDCGVNKCWWCEVEKPC